jgi:single-strand DNA-binding protein
MANVNKVILVGRLTRDPEVRTFGNGGKVAKFGFAVSERKKNQQTGQWEDGDPMFIDCDAFNRGEFGHLADVVEKYLRKGSLCYLEGRLKLERWDDKASGQKRSKHSLHVDVMQMLDTRQGGEGGPNRSAPPTPDAYAGDEGPSSGPAPTGGNEEIPF